MGSVGIGTCRGHLSRRQIPWIEKAVKATYQSNQFDLEKGFWINSHMSHDSKMSWSSLCAGSDFSCSLQRQLVSICVRWSIFHELWVCTTTYTITAESYGWKFFFTLFSLKSPRIVTRASSPWHKRANLLPDIYFSDTRFRSVVLFSSAGGEQRTKAPTTLHRVIDYRQKFFFFVRCHFESAFSFLSGEITEFMRLISQTALIIVGAHGSASQIFFNLSQSTKDDTWDVMRGDRRVEFEVSDVIPIKAHVP